MRFFDKIRAAATASRMLMGAAFAAAALALAMPGGIAQTLFLPNNTGVVGHLNAASGPPTGTGCTIVAGSADFAGSCTTSATSGSIAFAGAYTAAPSCVVVDATATPVAVYTTTTTQITLTTVTSAHVLFWQCTGKLGG